MSTYPGTRHLLLRKKKREIRLGRTSSVQQVPDIKPVFGQSTPSCKEDNSPLRGLDTELHTSLCRKVIPGRYCIHLLRHGLFFHFCVHKSVQLSDQIRFDTKGTPCSDANLLCFIRSSWNGTAKNCRANFYNKLIL